ncbi:hypothetical protein HCN44_004515 [Aphidius gifuensis]|uniref:Uncharacterized protein n=1 Tax=Aphidius gifuensis TaxID=684658 RepID=A0A835CV62_APHGI|nr:uncharacterized protein LOC122848832 [Aphidius gifuensis]XP_044003134.1 uncharacterized protein LOC122848832 [Aphidius gifuensis]KAF7995043.1 hypothetical protein HCN44_004515 [Aphidius gifuensis]
MTVMPDNDVADKAVSTEDTSVEIIRLDAMLAALVESKVESMKRDSSNSLKSKWESIAATNQNRSRLTSSSTASSFYYHHQHHSHDDNYQDYQRKNLKKKRDFKDNHRRRRHDSVPCDKFIDDIHNGHHKRHSGSKRRRRASEMPRSSSRKRDRYLQDDVLQEDVHMGLDSAIELYSLNPDLTLINFDRTRETINDTNEYPRLHKNTYFSQSMAHLKFHYDDEDYVALNLEDELDLDSLQSWNDHSKELKLKTERYHRSRRKRKRKRQRVEDLMMTQVPEVILVNHDELPSRARWTIVITACILFAMSLLLVGVTLRMAPIIDEMVRKKNEELINSLNRDMSVPENTTINT